MLPMNKLKNNQQNAIDFVESKAISSEADALSQLHRILLKTTGGKAIDVDKLLKALLKHARVTVCFHPDRITRDGAMVIDRLIDSGTYTNQFVTQISNGGVTAFPGGERDIWEQNMFGCAYHAQNTMSEERPKYGALNLMNFVDGAAPRFGSCCLVLNASILNRCTFSFGDSSTSPNAYGTSKHFAPVLLAILYALIECEKLLDFVPMGKYEAVDAILHGFSRRMPENGRENCRTIEAQIHGDFSLLRDVEAIHVDESFANTDIQEKVTRLCDKYNIQPCWIPRRYVFVDDIDDAFRGPLMKPIARRVLADLEVTSNELTAWRIGKAAQSVVRDPEKWASFGHGKQMLQYVKQLWHIVANYGCH